MLEVQERALDVQADQVRLEVARSARVPDSEVIGDRLKQLANAIGVRRTEVVEKPGPG